MVNPAASTRLRGTFSPLGVSSVENPRRKKTRTEAKAMVTPLIEKIPGLLDVTTDLYIKNPQMTVDIYTQVPSACRLFLYIPDIASAASVTRTPPACPDRGQPTAASPECRGLCLFVRSRRR